MNMDVDNLYYSDSAGDSEEEEYLQSDSDSDYSDSGSEDMESDSEEESESTYSEDYFDPSTVSEKSI